MDKRIKELKAEGRLEEIGMFETIRTELPNACLTTGMGPCMGLAIVNRRTNTVYLGHYAGQKVGDYEPLIDQAVREAASPTDLQAIMIAGQIASPKDYPEFRLYKRKAFRYAAALNTKLTSIGLSKDQITDRIRLRPTKYGYDLLVDPLEKKIYFMRLKEE